MAKSSSRRRRDKQQAAAEEVASLREKVATLEQQALARQPLRHGTPAARTPASRPSAPRAEPPPQEPSPQEDGEEPEEGDQQQQQGELDGDSNRNDGDAGDEGDASTPSDHSDGDQDDPDGAVQSGLAGDVLAGVQEQLESGSADNSRSMPPDVASTLAGILQKHSDADTVPPAWALNMLLPAPTSQVNTPIGSTASSTAAAVHNGGSLQPGLISAHAAPRTPAGSGSPIEPVNLAAVFAATTPPPARNTTTTSNPVVSHASPTHSAGHGTEQPSAHASGTSVRFVMKPTDLPKDLFFSGQPGQDIVELLTQFRARVKLCSVDNCPSHVVDQRAVKYLPLMLREAAYDSLLQLTEGTLEWRTEAHVTALRTQGESTRPVSPSSWAEYCQALSFLFSAPNRISVLAREIATLKQTENQSVDTYALKVTQARTRLIAEATRSAPANTSPFEHAWDVFLTAMFENGLQPAVRLECIREDATNSFQEARTRAKKHEANNLRGVSPTTPLSAHASAVVQPAQPQLCSAVASNSADIQDLAAEIKRLRTARNPKATPQTPSGGRKASTKRGPPQSSTGSNGQRKSSKTVEQRHCDYPKCNSRDSHNTDHCNLKKRDEKDGYERVRK